MTKDFSATEVFGVDENDPIDGVHMADVVDEVPASQVDGDLAVGRSLFENAGKRTES